MSKARPLELHEYASIFPEMTPGEFANLKASIEAYGQLEPIWIHEGKVVDGKCRLRACRELGIKPKTRKWDGKGSLVAFVVSMNLNRRHLTKGQLAMCHVIGEGMMERLERV
jgi:ParB-like chromosome segregation protein Spo0J